jgi:hypothetical protein
VNDAQARQARWLTPESYRTARGCLGKMRYPSRKNAAAAARVITRNSGELLEAYRCRYCKRWHIGHYYSARYRAAYG